MPNRYDASASCHRRTGSADSATPANAIADQPGDIDRQRAGLGIAFGIRQVQPSVVGERRIRQDVEQAQQYSVLFWLWEILPDQLPFMEKLTPVFVALERLLVRIGRRYSAHCFLVARSEAAAQ